LLPPLTGKDEVAVLDSVFHEMANSLEASAKREQAIQEMKKEFLAMLTHDLRAPLGSVRLCLNLLQEGEHGPIDEPGQQLISRTEVES
jgi:signal transduction histidine kinase